MRILAIETSCDETAISVIEAGGGIESASFRVISNIINSQIELHKKYGGVYPNLAKREHGRNLIPVLIEAIKLKKENSISQTSIKKEFSNEIIFKLKKLLEKNDELLNLFLKEIPNIDKPNINAIAFTYGPGLEPALWVGVNFAKALSLVWGIPVIPVNHMKGHIFSAFMNGDEFLISNIKFPVLALLASGGHTELILMNGWNEYKKIGQTRDDAAGEAFDKVARILGLSYPGGPEISCLAEKCKQIDESNTSTNLPRPMLNSPDFDFSFSGLKTAVLYMVNKIPNITDSTKAKIAKEFQQAVVDVLISKTIKAIKSYNAKTIVIGGGVAANKELRLQLKDTVEKEFPNSILMLPNIKLTGDNASMIAIAGYFKFLEKGALAEKDFESISANGNLSL